MVDTLSKKSRSKNMAAIRSKDTKPEMMVRRALHKIGLRYRLHNRHLPGKPDLVFPKFKAVVFVNGCFWHAHECHLFKWPATRELFWREKIGGNARRDQENYEDLRKLGWKVGIVWECALMGSGKIDMDAVVGLISDWLSKPDTFIVLSGSN